MPPRSGVACLFMRVGAWCLVLPSIPGGLSLTVRMAGALKACKSEGSSREKALVVQYP
jgi:hypothetical protein